MNESEKKAEKGEAPHGCTDRRDTVFAVHRTSSYPVPSHASLPVMSFLSYLDLFIQTMQGREIHM